MAICLGRLTQHFQTNPDGCLTREKQRTMKPVPWIFDVMISSDGPKNVLPLLSAHWSFRAKGTTLKTTLKTIDRTQLCLFLWENRSSEMGQTGQVHNKWWTFQTMSSPQKCTSSVVWKNHHLAVKPLETSNKNGRLGVVERISVASVWSPNQVQTGIICAIKCVYFKAVINIQKTQTVQPKGYKFCSLEISTKKKHGPVAQPLRLISLVLTSSPQAQDGGSLALLGHGPWILMWKMMVQWSSMIFNHATCSFFPNMLKQTQSSSPKIAISSRKIICQAHLWVFVQSTQLQSFNGFRML
jgi:hypothetical protein